MLLKICIYAEHGGHRNKHQRYMSKLDAVDPDEPALPPAKVERLQERIATPKAQMIELQKAPDQ